ncbi:hypothetical protein BD311DRAFT_523539 [Dichomitus squalens]|uniref:Uncharacterized protein n=1 Tax=Dichomitus squalens TaxID=114155 RepID=A0A4Q9MF67_9APHY|nr:hypothetical protein BD311DRAFT_523539 [Dichomitus squalens]
MPNPVSPTSSPTSLPLQGPHAMQADSYLNSYPTSIRISRDFSSTSHDQDFVDRDSLSTFTLTDDANITEIAPWAANNNDSEPLRLSYLAGVAYTMGAGLRALVFVQACSQVPCLGLCQLLIGPARCATQTLLVIWATRPEFASAGGWKLRGGEGDYCIPPSRLAAFGLARCCTHPAQSAIVLVHNNATRAV